MNIFIFFLLKVILKCDKLHHFMKKSKRFAPTYGIITVIKLELCSKAVEKKSGRFLKSYLHKL